MEKLLFTLALKSACLTGARAADADRLVLVGASYGKNVLAICEAGVLEQVIDLLCLGMR